MEASVVDLNQQTLSSRGALTAASHLNADTTRKTNTTTNSVASAHKRTIPTERPPLVGEVSTNFSG
jgi:hypothetical protein